MEKKTIVLTGASDGIGAAAARKLAEMGHLVIPVGRNKDKTARIARELHAPCLTADYTHLDSVARLAEELKKLGRIDVLANNAGGVQKERTLTADGFERTFQINVLGAFLLTNLLLDTLCASHATVIQTSSIAANLFSQNFSVGDWQNERAYSPFTAYGSAKLENILLTRALHKRFGEKGVAAAAFEPGVVRTNFAAESTGFVKFCYHSPLKYFFTISPQTSAERLIFLALGIPGETFIPGETYSGKRLMNVKFRDENGAAADALWNACTQMTKGYLQNQ
ncbi:MAG: SDR family NAD(P)-dependent oxidoreductase [Clostridia bacterium]|nr:SDR family NAD(P)-dependent oxidoreductase [Clostridia bacterium]